MADPSGAEAEIDGEEKRIRFQAPKKRFAALAAAPRATSQHDTVALVEGEEGYRLALDGDAGGAVDPRRACLLRSELLRLSQLEKRKDFLKLVHEPLWPLAQSLPEVLHNGDRIATVLGAAFADPATRVAGAYSLASVLARDAGPALGAEALAALVAGLAASVGDRSPPVAKAASDALGYVFRYCADGLLEGVEAGWPAARRHYGALLGAESEDARALGARVLAKLLRRIRKPKVLAKHLRKLLSVALRDRDERAAVVARSRDGLARLLFELAVGVGGRLHSRAGDVLGVVLARGGAVADRVLTLLLDATRPGDDVEPLWAAVVDGAANRASAGDAALGDALARLATVVSWRRARLLTNRDDDLKVDRALPRALARDRCDRLAALLDGLVAGAGAGAAPRDAGALVRAALAGAAAAPQGALRAVAAARGEAWVAGVLQAGGARDALAVLDALDDLEDAGAGVDAAADAALEAALAAAAAGDAAAGLAVAARAAKRGSGRLLDRVAAEIVAPPLEAAARAVDAAALAAALPALDVATALASAAAGPRVAALAAQLVDACSRRAFESEKTAELRVVRAAGLRALDALGQPHVAARAAAPLIAALTGRPAALGSAATLRVAAETIRRHGAAAAFNAPGAAGALADAVAPRLAAPSGAARALALELMAALGEPCDAELTVAAFDASEPSDGGAAFALRLCGAVEALPVALASERPMARLLGVAEALARRRGDGALGAAAARSFACHCCGLLTVRFEPLWAHATKVLAALDPGAKWPPLLALLQRASSAAAAAPSKKRRGGEPDAADLAGALARAARDDDAATGGGRASGVWEADDDGALDADRSHAVAWDAAAACGAVGGASADGARAAVELFVTFLRVDLFDDGGDPDAKEILPLLPRACGDRYGRDSPLPGAARHRRLETLLRVFAGAAAPKSLPHGDALRAVYERLLGKPRGDVASLALKCLAPYKVPHLAPYAARVAALLDDATLRDTLVKLGASREARGVGAVEAGAGGWQIDDTHRAGLIPVLCRVLFGRFRAKSAAVGGRRKASPAARRATILSFLAALDPSELDAFLVLMFRPLLPSGGLDSLAPLRGREDAERAVAACSESRVSGLLQLLRAVVAKLGYRVEAHAGTFLGVVLAVLAARGEAEEEAVEDEEEDDEEEEVVDGSKSRRKRERHLALKCCKELLDQFAESDVLWAVDGGLKERLWAPLGSHLASLAGSSGGQARSPALLEVVAAACAYPSLRAAVAPGAVAALAACAADAKLALDGVCGLLAEDDSSGAALLRPEAAAVVAALGRALDGSAARRLNKTQLRALNALRRVAELATLPSDDANFWPLGDGDASRLAATLVPRLKIVGAAHDTSIATTRDTIRTCLGALFPRVARPFSHAQSLVALLGPPRRKRRSTELFAASDRGDAVRAVALTFVDLARGHEDLRAPSLKAGADLVEALVAVDESSLDGAPDFEKAGAALQDLADAGAWAPLLADADVGALGAAPVVALLQTLARDSDAALRDGAARASRAFLAAAAAAASHGKTWTAEWVATTCLLPHVMGALELGDDGPRRAAVSALGAAAAKSSATFLAPAVALKRFANDNADLDLFENVAHLQAHRRARALKRAAAVFASAELDDAARRDAARFLLPLALQPLYDARAQDALVKEAAACVGVVASALPWSRYGQLAKRLATVIENQARLHERLSRPKANSQQAPSGAASRKEKPKFRDMQLQSSKALEATFVAAFCHVLDNFHFLDGADDAMDVEEEEEDEEEEEEDAEEEEEEADAPAQPPKADKVSAGLHGWLLPTARRLLKKPVRAKKTGARDEVLRAPVALAILRLAAKLPAAARDSETRGLVVSVCGGLRHRDATQRDVGRATLAKMVVFLSPTCLPLVLRELKAALHSGYMLAVRSAAVHSIVAALQSAGADALGALGKEAASAPATVDDPAVADAAAAACAHSLDAGVAPLVELLVDDLLGSAAKTFDGRAAGDHKAGSASGVPEAAKVVSRTYESLELLAKSVLYRPSYATRDAGAPDDAPVARSAAHALVRPLFDALAQRAGEEDDARATEAGRCRAAVARVAAGFAANPSSCGGELVYHAVAILTRTGVVTRDAAPDVDESDSDDDSDDGSLAPLAMDEADMVPRRVRTNAGAATAWLPSAGDASSSKAEALARKRKREQENVAVIDGASAPKLTGRDRHGGVLERASHRRAVRDEKSRFAVHLLRFGLRKHKLQSCDDAVKATATPLLGMLARAYRGLRGDEELQLGVVAVASALLGWKLEGAARWAPRLAKVALETLRRCSRFGGAPVGDGAQGAFKMLAALLGGKSDDGYEVSLADAQLKAVASSVRAALSESALADDDSFASNRAATYALLLAMVRRPVVVAEIYDVMDAVAELQVTSLERAERKRASAILLKFVLTYPMGKKRMKHHLGQLLLGLDYAYEEGRLAALDALAAALRALPPATVDEHGASFFAQLAMRCGNEASAACAARVKDVLATLLGRVAPETRAGLLQRCLDFLDAAGSEDRAAEFDAAEKLASLRLLAARVAEAFAGHLDEPKLARKVLAKLSGALAAAADDDGALDATLAALAAFARRAPDAGRAFDAEPRVVGAVLDALRKRRLGAAAFFGVCFDAGLLGSAEVHGAVATASCAALDAGDDRFDSALATQSSKNLLFVLGSGLVDAGAAREALETLAAAAGRRGDGRRRAVFAVFAACLERAPAALEACLGKCVAPLHRAIDEERERDAAARDWGKKRTEDRDTATAALAQDVLQRFEDAFGAETVARAVGAVVSELRRKRDERKAAKKKMAVTDPAGFSKRKLARGEEKKAGRKRKAAGV